MFGHLLMLYMKGLKIPILKFIFYVENLLDFVRLSQKLDSVNFFFEFTPPFFIVLAIFTLFDDVECLISHILQACQIKYFYVAIN